MSKDDTTRTTTTGTKQQPATQAGAPGGLAAAMNNASKQEIMMPGHRLREKASGIYKIFIDIKKLIYMNIN